MITMEIYKSKINCPRGVEVLNPYLDDEVMKLCKIFYDKYYNDDRGRVFIVGINPGRFGAGITGIPFTDPVVLEKIVEYLMILRT